MKSSPKRWISTLRTRLKWLTETITIVQMLCIGYYCSLVTFREVFCEKLENPRIAARNHALRVSGPHREALL